MTTTPKTVLQFLEKHRRGSLAVELGVRWRELLDAVHTYHAAGTLTLKIAVKPVRNDGRRVEIVPTIDVKLPKPEAATGSYYIAETTNGLDLSLLDPDQDPLPGMAPEEPAPAVPLQLIQRPKEAAQ